MIVTSRKAVYSIIAVIALLVFIGYATSAEKILTTIADSVTIALDKNGVEYVRIIATEEKSLQGIKYTIGVPIMAFGSLVAEAKTIKAGDDFKAIVQTRQYNGSDSYTIVSFIK